MSHAQEFAARVREKRVQYVIKIVLTALIVVAVAEVAKRNSIWAAALAALPLTSLLAFIWIYIDTADTARIASMSFSIVWLVLASLPLFLLLPALLRAGWNFWPALASACAATSVAYFAVVWLLGHFGES